MEKQELIDFFKALANEKRQQMLTEVFLDGLPHSVTEVADHVELAMSTTSAHLNILKRANILSSEKIGKDVFYQGNREYLSRVFKTLADKFSCC